jgi:hypothetical protein
VELFHKLMFCNGTRGPHKRFRVHWSCWHIKNRGFLRIFRTVKENFSIFTSRLILVVTNFVE